MCDCMAVGKFSLMWIFGFFFSSRRRHTRLQGDWSSDVCSSDLFGGTCTVNGTACTFTVNVTDNGEPGTNDSFIISVSGEIGRASCRERVEISVVAVSLKKKET